MSGRFEIYLVTRDASGKEISRLECSSFKHAESALALKRWNQAHLRHSIEDAKGRDLAQSIAVVPVPRKSDQAAPSNPVDKDELERRWLATSKAYEDADRRDKAFIDQHKGRETTFVEVRHDTSKKLYGWLVTEWRVPNYWADEPDEVISRIVLTVDEADASQVRTAFRERKAEGELPITTQAKAFELVKEVSRDGRAKLVAYVDPADVWNFQRDERFRRAPEWGSPATHHQLTRRDRQILKSVQQFHKTKPGGGYEDEAKLLISYGLISTSGPDGSVLHLTKRGAEFLKAAEAE